MIPVTQFSKVCLNESAQVFFREFCLIAYLFHKSLIEITTSSQRLVFCNPKNILSTAVPRYLLRKKTVNAALFIFRIPALSATCWQSTRFRRVNNIPYQFEHGTLMRSFLKISNRSLSFVFDQCARWRGDVRTSVTRRIKTQYAYSRAAVKQFSDH